jgi:hypothetical protein
MDNTESFQHYRFSSNIKNGFVEGVKIYIILAFEVKLKVKTQLKTQINLNKSMKTIYKSCYFITATSF